MLGHLVLDEAEDPGRGADGLRDPEQVEVLLVPRVVHPRDHLRHPVALLGDLRDHEVVLVVSRHGEHDVGRTVDPRALEHVDLGRVAAQRHRAELLLEQLEAVAALLDERHLVSHVEQRRGDVRPDLAAAGDDQVHQAASTGVGVSVTSQARTASAREEIAVCVGQTVSRPSLAKNAARRGSRTRTTTQEMP